MGITWKGKEDDGTPGRNDGSLYLGVALALLYISAWMSNGLGIPSFALFFGGGLMGLAPLVTMIVGIALPIVAVILLRRRDRCLTDVGVGRWRFGSWLLQVLGVFLAVRPLLLILFGHWLIQGCTTRPFWLGLFGPL